MVGIGSQQCAQGGGVLAGAAAAALVVQKLDAVYIFKKPALAMTCWPKINCFHISALLIGPYYLLCKAVVFIRDRIAKLLMQAVFDDVQVSVLAEHCWNKQPIVGGPHPAITSLVTIKSAIQKF